MPDFVVHLNIAAKPAASNFLEGTTDGQYSWNASRYPWQMLTMIGMTGRWARPQ